MVAIRSKTNHNMINASIIKNNLISNQLELKQTVHHFFLKESCLQLKTNSQELINFWLIPKNLCPNLNIVNDYGYSYRYTLKMEPHNTTCIFFQGLKTKHHITISPIDSSMALKTDIYNTQSLLNNQPFQTFSTTQSSHTFSDSEPFFLKLTLRSKESKIFRISLVSAEFPILYSKCKAEEIQNITDIDSVGTRYQPPNIQSTQCVNVIDELKLFLIVIFAFFALLIVILIIFYFFGCINAHFFYGMCQSPFKSRFDGPKKGVISKSHKNSMDIDTSINGHSDSELLT